MFTANVQTIGPAHRSGKPIQRKAVRVEIKKRSVLSLREEFSRYGRDLLTLAERRACDMATD